MIAGTVRSSADSRFSRGGVADSPHLTPATLPKDDAALLTDPFFYLVATAAVIVVGLAKGGFAGIGILAVPLMALAVPPVQAAAILLPILIVQDVVGVWAFRRTWDAANLKLLIPAATVGIALAYAFAAMVSDAAVALAVGLVSVAFGAWRLVGASADLTPRPGNRLFGAVCGVAAGFTSTISHAGGPPFQIYMLPQRLERDRFIGTSAIFFAAINWLKVPAYAGLGEFTRENLLTALAMMPVAIVATFAGVRLVRRLSGERFYGVIHVLLILVGLKLVGDGLGLWS